MPDFAVDTSIYPKLDPPGAAIDRIGKVIDVQRGQQQLQSGAIGIDKQKLDLINQRFEGMVKDFTGLMAQPDLNEDKIRKRIQQDVKFGIVTPEMAGTFITQLPPTQGMKPNQAAATLKDHLSTWLNHAQTIKEAIDTQFGNQSTQTDSQNTYSGVQQNPINGGGFVPSTRMPIQVPPTQPTINGQMQPGVVGASAAPGVYPAQPQNNLPVASPSVPMPQPRPQGLPVAPPAASGPTGPTVSRGTDFNNRFAGDQPGFIPTGAAPGVVAAAGSVAEQSGKDYASDLTRAKNLQSDLYPANRVLSILHEEGPTAFGQGTDNLNVLKNAMVTWFPNSGVDASKVANFEEAKKQLVQLARSNGNSGTNDQLAAAFEGSPNTKMTGATIESVVKSIVALRKMQSAQTLMFGQTGLLADQYSKWIAEHQNQFDPRAFGFDLMDREKQDKLLSSMTEKDNDSSEMKAAKAKAYTKFKNTLQFAHDSDLIGNNE